MKRLLLVAPLAAAAILLFGCSGDTDPATNITSDAATLHSHGGCDAGESGTMFYRWRIASQPESTGWWSGGAIPFTCDKAQSGDLPAHRATGLVPDTVYVFQVCVNVGRGHDAQNLCTGDRQFKTLPFPASAGVAGDNAYPGYNDAPSPDPVEGGAYDVAVTSSGCFGDQACASGVGTKWFCGTAKVGHSIKAPWTIFRGTLSLDSYCWGTGKNRGQFLNYNNARVNHDTTLYGETAVGVVYDDISYTLGPQVANGKLTTIRTLHFHTCNPPIGSLPIHACFGKHDWYLKLRIISWTSTDNMNHYTTLWKVS